MSRTGARMKRTDAGMSRTGARMKRTDAGMSRTGARMKASDARMRLMTAPGSFMAVGTSLVDVLDRGTGAGARFPLRFPTYTNKSTSPLK